MLIITIVLFIVSLAVCLNASFRLHRAPSRRDRIWLAVSGVAVLVFGAATAATFGQLKLIAHQRTFLQAALGAFTSTKAQIARYDAKGNALPVQCDKAVAAAKAFYTNYATVPTWHQTPVFDHAIPAVLSHVTYQLLAADKCVSPSEVSAVLTSLRAEQVSERRDIGLTTRFLTWAPIALVPGAPSMRSESSYVWGKLSPHAIATQACFDALHRASPNASSFTPAQTDACMAPTPHVLAPAA